MNVKFFISKFPKPIRLRITTIISDGEVFFWKFNNSPLPMPHKKKVEIIRNYAKKYSLKIFVETGTYLGQTVDDLSKDFKTVYSIELDKKLATQAKKNFLESKNVKIFQGDSSKVLKKIVPGLNQPTLFWLDAHYSGGITAKGTKDTPIIEELNIISKNLIGGSAILIDDAREFTGHGDYPKIERIKNFVSLKMKKYKMSVKDDIIRIYPK